jgi:hypothetical protein
VAISLATQRQFRGVVVDGFVGELHVIFRDIKFLVSTHQTVVLENTLSLYLCNFFSYALV